MSKQSAFNTLAQAAPQYKTSQATKSAYSRLNSLASGKSGWGKAIGENLKRYTAMGDFDPQKSAYYQGAYNALKQTYQNRGNSDMEDTIAAAAANTGGYGNSYGTTAGNRAYNAQLQALAAQVPKLYAAAAGDLRTKRATSLRSSACSRQSSRRRSITRSSKWVCSRIWMRSATLPLPRATMPCASLQSCSYNTVCR